MSETNRSVHGTSQEVLIPMIEWCQATFSEIVQNLEFWKNTKGAKLETWKPTNQQTDEGIDVDEDLSAFLFICTQSFSFEKISSDT